MILHSFSLDHLIPNPIERGKMRGEEEDSFFSERNGERRQEDIKHGHKDRSSEHAAEIVCILFFPPIDDAPFILNTFQ